MMVAIKTLQSLKNSERELYLFDTFEGMSKPTKYDISVEHSHAIDKFSTSKIDEQSSSWNKISLSEVKENILNLAGEIIKEFQK